MSIMEPTMLRRFCIDNELFCGGTSEQYSMLFKLNDAEMHNEREAEIAINKVVFTIWICSLDRGYTYEELYIKFADCVVQNLRGGDL